MGFYEYLIHNGRDRDELLGAERVDSDLAAAAFGKKVISDLLRERPAEFLEWTMTIVDGHRHVATIPFRPTAIERSKLRAAESDLLNRTLFAPDSASAVPK